MTFVEEMMSIWLPGDVYNSPFNEGEIDYDTYVNIIVENRHFAKLAYFNGKWYDAAEYVRKAADEIGNVGRVNNKKHAEICRKYADRFVEDVLAGKVEPVDVDEISKRKKAAKT